MPRRLVLLAAAIVALAVVVVPVAVSDAATYAVWACADPLGQPLTVGDWSPATVGAQVGASTTCGINATATTAGSMQAGAGAGPYQPDSGDEASWNVAAAPNTSISGLDVWWTNSAGVQAPGRVQIYVGGASVYMRDAGSFGIVSTPFSDATNRQAFSGLSGSTAALVAWCLSTCARPDRAISSVFNAYRVKVTVRDDVAPTGPVGGITEGMSVAGPVAIQAQASDTGGGVRDLQLVVDGKVVDARTAGGQCEDLSPTTGDANEYTVMHPCLAKLPAGGPTTFMLTPAMLGAAGPHNVSVIAHDAAGNAGTLLSHTVVIAPATVDGAPPASRYDRARDLFFNPDADLSGPARANGANASAGARMTLVFVTRHVRRVNGHRRVVKALSRRRTVGYSTAARLRGRVTAPGGAPIVGGRVWRAISVAGAPWKISGKPLTTSKTGAVSVLMPARAPSRRVELVYFPTTDSNVSSRSPAALMAVRAPVSLQVARRSVPRGGRIVMTARLRAGQTGGAVLGTLQVLQRGSWRPIRQLRFKAARGGRGVARVALRLRTPAAYRFRALVVSQTTLRYARGVSPARTVRVR